MEFAHSALPRNLESLWQQCAQIFFAPIPLGHEIDSFVSSRASELNEMQADTSSKKKCLIAHVSGNFESQNVQVLCSLESPFNDSNVMEIEEDKRMDMSEECLIKSALEQIRHKISRICGDILLPKIRDEQSTRFNRKDHFDLESKLITFYERKSPTVTPPPSSSSYSFSPVPPSLSLLGKSQPQLQEADDSLCCSICGDGEGNEANEIIICDGCHFATHQQCYSVSEIPSHAWYCVLCTLRKRNIKRVDGSDKCVLCLKDSSFEGGSLMKPLSSSPSSSWAHLRCVNWVPEACLSPDGQFVIIHPNKDREELRCSLCKAKGGSPIQCAFGKCTTAYHVSCAAKAGLLDHSLLMTSRSLTCSRHVKQSMRLPTCVSRLVSNRKIDFYSRFMNDRFLAISPSSVTTTSICSLAEDGWYYFLLKCFRSHPTVSAYLCAIKENHKYNRTSRHSSNLGREHFYSLEFPQLLVSAADDITLQEFRSSIDSSFPVPSVCCECLKDDNSGNFMHCTQCGLHAHDACLNRMGVPILNKSGGSGNLLSKIETFPFISFFENDEFTCFRCQAVKVGRAKLQQTFCILCMQLGGFLVHVESLEDVQWSPQGIWVHPRCSFWLLPPSMVSYTSPVQMPSASDTLRHITGSFHFFSCCVCGSRLGCQIKCSQANCSRRFHISCGFCAGFEFIIKSALNGLVAAGRNQPEEGGEQAVVNALLDSSSSKLRRIAYCWEHIKSNKDGRRRRIDTPLSGSIRVQAKGSWYPPETSTELIDEFKTPREPKRRKSERKRKTSELRLSFEGEDDNILIPSEYIEELDIPIMKVQEQDDWEGCCAECKKPWDITKDFDSIACDYCDQWFHFKCVGLRQGQEPPSGKFSCPGCKEKRNISKDSGEDDADDYDEEFFD